MEFVEVLAEVERRHDPAGRQAARTNVLSLWAESDPRGAFLHLKTHGSGAADAYLCDIFFRRWAELDFPGAIDYAERQPAGKVREEMLGGLALAVSRLSPAEAAGMVMQDMAAGPFRTETALSVLHQWAQKNLVQAAAWAATFPGPDRERALQEIAAFELSRPARNSPD